MKFSEDMGQFVFEYNGLIFAWDDEPEDGYLEQVKIVSENPLSDLQYFSIDG